MEDVLYNLWFMTVLFIGLMYLGFSNADIKYKRLIITFVYVVLIIWIYSRRGVEDVFYNVLLSSAWVWTFNQNSTQERTCFTCREPSHFNTKKRKAEPQLSEVISKMVSTNETVSHIYDSCGSEVSKKVVDIIMDAMFKKYKKLYKLSGDEEMKFDRPVIVVAILDTRFLSNIEGALSNINEQHYNKVALVIGHVKVKDKTARASELKTHEKYGKLGLCVDFFYDNTNDFFMKQLIFNKYMESLINLIGFNKMISYRNKDAFDKLEKFIDEF